MNMYVILLSGVLSLYIKNIYIYKKKTCYSKTLSQQWLIFFIDMSLQFVQNIF